MNTQQQQQIFKDSLAASGLVGGYGLGQFDKVWAYMQAPVKDRNSIFTEEGAPKTWSFSQNLQGNLRMVCVDSHLCWASVGGFDAGGTVKFTLKTYHRIAKVVADLARDNGMHPAQMQAILWIVRKRILDNKEFSSGIFPEYKERRSLTNPRDTSPYLEVPMFNEHFDHGGWLQWLWEQATPEEIAEGMTWYDDAMLRIVKLSAELGVTRKYLADVVAMISPGRDWKYNIDQAVEVIHCYRWSTRQSR